MGCRCRCPWRRRRPRLSCIGLAGTRLDGYSCALSGLVMLLGTLLICLLLLEDAAAAGSLGSVSSGSGAVSTSSGEHKVLYAWGRNNAGQLGVGHKKDVAEPMAVDAFLAKDIRALAVRQRRGIHVGAKPLRVPRPRQREFARVRGRANGGGCAEQQEGRGCCGRRR